MVDTVRNAGPMSLVGFVIGGKGGIDDLHDLDKAAEVAQDHEAGVTMLTGALIQELRAHCAKVEQIHAEIRPFEERLRAYSSRPADERNPAELLVVAQELANASTAVLDEIKKSARARERYFEHLESCWIETSNPLFVFLAIKFAKIFKDRPTSDLSKKFVLPDWCLAYLEKSADDVLALVDDKELPAGGCVSQISGILGFSRPGWNAYNHFRELRDSDKINRTYVNGRRQGVAAQKLLNEIAETFGLSDERSVRRRIANLKKQVKTLQGG